MIGASVYRQRQQRLAGFFPTGTAVVVSAGVPRFRNFPANEFPFRTSSSALFLAGILPARSILVCSAGQSTLYVADRNVLWDGAGETHESIVSRTGVLSVSPVSSLIDDLAGYSSVVILPESDPGSVEYLRQVLGKWTQETGQSEELIGRIVEMRLCHDSAGREELSAAAHITVECLEALRATAREVQTERDVEALLLYQCAKHGVVPAFQPIVTQIPEMLHGHATEARLGRRPWLLVDFGIELGSGYCADVTRMFAVSAELPTLATELVAMVADVQRHACSLVIAGSRFSDIHRAAELRLAEGLVSLDVLRGSTEELVEREVVAAFFPHGIGHLLGIDVHDMEEFGDRVGYPVGRQRSTRLGRNALRFDRDLQPGMAVTIEPGCYFIEPLLRAIRLDSDRRTYLNETRLKECAEFGGVRIEDTVLVTDAQPEVLTGNLSTALSQLR